MTQKLSFDNLNPEQRSAVEYSGGPLLIAAGAGSGKTKTLTSRLAHLIRSGAKPENIVAITFTNKAAQEMRDRVSFSGPGPFIGTFHSLGARILKNEAGLAKRTPNYTIFDDDDSMSLLKKVMKAMELDKEKHNPKDYHYKISDIKNELLDPEDDFDPTTVRVFENYEKALTANNAFDFDDLIEKIVRVFQKNPKTLKKYQNQFQYILVDEYQDINTAQYWMIKLLAQEHQNLSVVGDDAQAIYSFRGADFRNFLNFTEDWPKAKIVKLEQNYRSSGTIITAASELLKNNKLQTPKTLWTKNEPGSLIKVVRAGEPEQEADFVASTIRQSGNIAATAVLYRTNAQSRSIEQALITANIPYKIFGGLKFYERKEVKDLVAALRLANNPSDSISAERISKNFDKKTAQHLLSELPRLGKNLGILELINYFLVNADYFEYLEKNYRNHLERVENINELITFAGGFKSLDEFLERVSLLQSTDAPAKSNTITNDNNYDKKCSCDSNNKNCHRHGNSHGVIQLMTIHMAKGLEFDNVFVIGCGEGLLPHQMSYGSMDELEEERRLMYVAMTRAKKNLTLSFYNTPSRFLYEMPPELTEFTDLDGGRGELPDADDMYIDYN